MQTNLIKKSNIFDRILQIIEYYDIKNVTVFAKEWLGYDSAEKINRLKKENNKPSVDILLDISNKFDEIDAGWILTGEGEMLKAPAIQTKKNDCPECNEVQILKTHISGLEKQLQEKERTIQILMGNIKESRITG